MSDNLCGEEADADANQQNAVQPRADDEQGGPEMN